MASEPVDVLRRIRKRNQAEWAKIAHLLAPEDTSQAEEEAFFDAAETALEALKGSPLVPAIGVSALPETIEELSLRVQAYRADEARLMKLVGELRERIAQLKRALPQFDGHMLHFGNVAWGVENRLLADMSDAAKDAFRKWLERLQIAATAKDA